MGGGGGGVRGGVFSLTKGSMIFFLSAFKTIYFFSSTIETDFFFITVEHYICIGFNMYLLFQFWFCQITNNKTVHLSVDLCNLIYNMLYTRMGRKNGKFYEVKNQQQKNCHPFPTKFDTKTEYGLED